MNACKMTKGATTNKNLERGHKRNDNDATMDTMHKMQRSLLWFKSVPAKPSPQTTAVHSAQE